MTTSTGTPTPAEAPPRRRRQIGADRRTTPPPAVPRRASAGALALGRLALLVTGGAWLAYVVTVVVRQAQSPGTLSVRSVAETLLYLSMITLLALSAGAYLVTRQGYLRRTRSHVRVPRAELDAHFAERSPSATVIVPSYREQPEVIRQTMLSAALQELPSLRVVLLVDDPPSPSTEAQRDLLEAARAIPGEIAELLAVPRARAAAGYERAVASLGDGNAGDATEADLEAVAGDYEHAVAWLEDLADGWVRHDHTDDFFVDHVLRALAADLGVVAAAVRGALLHRSTTSAERVVQLQRRLLSVFGAELTSFERKRYLGLSWEPNKAMNLNSYIGLMGGSYREQETTAGALLLPCDPGDPEATLHVPSTDYLVTLDADSVLLPDYCVRLVHRMEQPGNERIGVGQTPYSAYPGAPTRVERLAGATTDLQHIVHQGMAEHDAAFWVGANAVIRVAAVEDLRVDDTSEGHVISRFISDRTVIEDTESTLDLTAKGWTIHNEPERLAYSASPPDFGTLCIQRQRWANGGLIILPKLVTDWRARRARGEQRSLVGLVLRLNYLASITWATVGLVLLLLYPFSAGLMSGLVIVMSAPYFVVMATDLKRCGYKRTDVFRIYGFNLIMLPVNASGVLRSLGQLVSGHKVAFARTPKVRTRSVAPALFVVFPYVIVAVSLAALASDIGEQRWVHAVFAGANAAIAIPAIVAVIGIRHSFADAWIGFTNQLYTVPKAGGRPVELDPVVDWATVLYHGSVEQPRGPHRPAPARRRRPAVAPVPAADLSPSPLPALALSVVPAAQKELVG